MELKPIITGGENRDIVCVHACMCVCMYDVLYKVQDNHGTVYALNLNHEMKLNTH
jgi:hypothetical protein